MKENRLCKYILTHKADLIGWLGSLFFVVGSVLLAYHSVWGFVANFIGNACYVVQGGWARLPSLWVLSVLLATLNCFGIYKWIGAP